MDKDVEIALSIAKKAAEMGGCAYFIGGYVRDRLLNKENKDIDIEVHGVDSKTLEKILDSLGDRINIGESFGIYALKGCNIDIAMPRKEELRGRGHKAFDVFTDPFIGTFKAARRRDFTINAIMQNVLTGEITDHFGGIADLKKGIIRHVNDEKFAEDPLRVLRAAQFAARFEFDIAEETVNLCRGIALDTLSSERVFGELSKAMLKAARPSLFFENLKEMNGLHEWFPEAEQLIDIPQEPKYHPEGDVWNHTMMVVDNAAAYRDIVKYPEGFMLAALTHDFGKIICTERIDGVIHSYGHEIKGLPVIQVFLERLTHEKRLIKYVLNMCEYHMKPNVLAANKASVKSTNKMFDKMAEPYDLIFLAAADKSCSGDKEKIKENVDFLKERLKMYNDIMSRPHVVGEDLINSGLKPGAYFSDILNYTHKLRLAGINKENALKQALGYAGKLL